MRSLQLTLTGLLAHNEENSSLTHPLHPIVVYCHLAYISVLLVVWGLWTDKTPGQNLYFLMTIGLYISSAAYHTWKADPLSRFGKFLRFIDQTMISWYILVLPMPYLYQEPWTLPVLLSMMVLTAANKWYEWEPNYMFGSLVFFGLGAVSFVLVITLGLDAIDTSIVSWAGLGVIGATAFFIGKLHIYRKRKGNLIPNVWESPESGHCVLSGGVSIITLIIIMNPV